MTDELHLQRGRLATFLRPIWEPLVSDHIGRYYDYHDEIWAWKADAFTCLCPDFRPNKVGFPMHGRTDIEPIAAQRVSTHKEWFNRTGKKTRNLVRKAEKTLAWWPWDQEWVEDEDDRAELAKIIHTVFSETPIRQSMKFPNYGDSIETIKGKVDYYFGVTETKRKLPDAEYVTVHLQESVRPPFKAIPVKSQGVVALGPAVGFARMLANPDTKVCMVDQFLSLVSAREHSPSNLLMSAVIRRCEENEWKYLTFGKMGTGSHLSLDQFKASNGFKVWHCVRGSVAINRRGRLALRLGFHRPVQDRAPRRLIPLARRIKSVMT